jgi:hypothetical protein
VAKAHDRAFSPSGKRSDEPVLIPGGIEIPNAREALVGHAGEIQVRFDSNTKTAWIPACAGMTEKEQPESIHQSQ